MWFMCDLLLARDVSTPPHRPLWAAGMSLTTLPLASLSGPRGIQKAPCSYDSVLSGAHSCHTLTIRSESMKPAHSCGRGKIKYSKGIMGLLRPEPIGEDEVWLQEP